MRKKKVDKERNQKTVKKIQTLILSASDRSLKDKSFLEGLIMAALIFSECFSLNDEDAKKEVLHSFMKMTTPITLKQWRKLKRET